jgi:DNA-binding transcriptional LysR family regulator
MRKYLREALFDMHIRWLKDFLILADCRKFTLAAQLSASSQAAFSRRIQQLEQHLKTELFDRSQTPIKLTPEGKRLYPIASEMIQIADRCKTMLVTKENPIVIASLHTLACNFFPAWYSTILEHSGTRIVTSIDSGVRSVSGYQAALQSQRADCLLFYQSNESANYFASDEYEVLKLCDDALIWVCGARFPAAALQEAQIPLLDYAPSSQLSELATPLFYTTPESQKLSTVFQSTISEALLPMVIHGHGVACIPHSIATPYLAQKRLVHIWSEYRCPLEIVLIRLRDAKNQHPQLNHLFDTATRLVKELDVPVDTDNMFFNINREKI